jgi:hypothetical protein
LALTQAIDLTNIFFQIRVKIQEFLPDCQLANDQNPADTAGPRWSRFTGQFGSKAKTVPA